VVEDQFDPGDVAACHPGCVGLDAPCEQAPESLLSRAALVAVLRGELVWIASGEPWGGAGTSSKLDELIGPRLRLGRPRALRVGHRLDNRKADARGPRRGDLASVRDNKSTRADPVYGDLAAVAEG
jgi:hypothetical protein